MLSASICSFLKEFFTHKCVVSVLQFNKRSILNFKSGISYWFGGSKLVSFIRYLSNLKFKILLSRKNCVFYKINILIFKLSCRYNYVKR